MSSISSKRNFLNNISHSSEWIFRKKRKKQADKPMRFFEELNRPVTYILDDVKETIVTENTYKPVTMNVLKKYFLPKGWL